MNGVEDMLYMSSTCSSDGSYGLTVTFEVGTEPRHRPGARAEPRGASRKPLLPEDVQRQGVTVKKQSTNIILVVALTSPDGRYDSLFLANYATLRIRDELARIDGVGDVNVFGAGDYSMRVWLDPQQLKARGLTTQDVIDAIREQNVQVAAGQIGQPPAPPTQNFQFTVTTLGRLTDVAQFEDIIVKTRGQPHHAAPRRGPRRARRPGLRSVLPEERQAGAPASPSFSSRAPTRSTWPTRCARRWSS